MKQQEALRKRLANIEKRLLQLHQQLSSRTTPGPRQVNLQEWNNNFYVVQAQVRKVRTLLKKVNDLPGTDVPRIHALMGKFISLSNAQVDFTNLLEFIGHYQQTETLQTNELKSVQPMIKMALLETVCKVVEKLNDAEEKQQPGTPRDRLALRSCISSLRLLDTVDWELFIDETSKVDAVLRQERSGVYAAMDFHTRDRYRDAVALLAKKAGIPEMQVAERAVLLADAAPNGHVGNYLGKKTAGRRFKTNAYMAGIVALTLVITALLLAGIHTPGWLLVPITLLLLLCASEIAKLIVDAIVGFTTTPELLPRLDYSKGIPQESATLVAVPALLSSAQEIDELVHALEVRWLANRSPNLFFALVTDFKDAPAETLPEDEALLNKMAGMIRTLNKQYTGNEHGLFFLFHRPRKWNAAENAWMGYERKRGKLLELNLLLRGQGMDKFSHIEGDVQSIQHIQYVITLDSDTLLPRDAAWKMAATMAHVLNRPVYDAAKRRVVAGYGMLQPRVRPAMLEGKGSLFQQWSGVDPDIDPYTRAAPDVYQDISGEGSFIGKGIYDVDMAIKVLDHAFPENRILSHDLLEGCYLRSGLVSDVTLYEQSPTYVTEIKRRHRWIRGDWQAAAWLAPLVPASNGKLVRNTLSVLSRWKIADNLRISLLPIARLLLFMAGIFAVDHALYFSLVLLCTFFFPVPVTFLVKLLWQPKKIFSAQQWKSTTLATGGTFRLNVYALVCIPYEAIVNLHAICIAHWRMLASRKKLLEWMPSYYQHKINYSLASIARIMWPSSALSVALAVGLFMANPAFVVLVLPLLLLWICAWFIVWKVNKPGSARPSPLVAEQVAFLQKLARRTWSYFDTHINRRSNWLPPDHYREYPAAKLAAYTSPTNMGLALLSDLAAVDFGYLSQGRFIERTANVLRVMGCLERYKGHFFNWYNIHSLEASHPRYVSSVDSGNLAGHLLVLRQALRTAAQNKMLGPELYEGMRHALGILQEELGMEVTFPAPSAHTPIAIREFTENISAYIAALAMQPQNAEVQYWMAAIQRQCNDINNELELVAPWLWLPPVPAKFSELAPQTIPSLQELKDMQLPAIDESGLSTAEKEWLDEYKSCFKKSKRVANDRIALLERMVKQCADFTDMEYDFLYNRSEQLLSIGYHVDTATADAGYYDVLASEARLAFYVAICQGKLPVKSWFILGRTLVGQGSAAAMLSANGTMFEYLMPELVMPSYPKTLLRQACGAAVSQQIAHGLQRGVPWGVSESAYSATDEELNYQYKVFGVPELSLKHTHAADDVVITPYASAMALMVKPVEACNNLVNLAQQGVQGRHGLYEAVDYTPSRMLHKDPCTVVRSFMVHHQGMSFLGFASLLLDKPMQKRFLADAELSSCIQLLQEQVPADAGLSAHIAEEITTGIVQASAAVKASGIQLLSNGKYQVMVNSDGSSLSHWEDIAITKQGGVFCTVRDVKERKSWPTTHETYFGTGNAEFHCTRKDLSCITNIVVLPHENIEMRQITLRNNSSEKKQIELAAHAQIAMTSVHDTEEEILEPEIEQHAILYGRRAGQREPWMFMSMNGADASAVFYETSSDELSIKYKLSINPGETVTVNLFIGIEESKAACIQLLNRSKELALTDALMQEIRNYNLSVLKRVNANETDLVLFRQLAGAIGDVKHGTILLSISNPEQVEVVEKIIQMHAYWRLKGLTANIVIWNEATGPYKNFLQRLIMELITNGVGAESLNRPNGIELKFIDKLNAEDRRLLREAAYVIRAGKWTELYQIQPRVRLENTPFYNPI